MAWTDARVSGSRYKFDGGRGKTVRDKRGRVIEPEEGKDCIRYNRGDLDPEDCEDAYEAICMEDDKTCEDEK